MLISAILFLTAGGYVFFLILNRVVTRFKDGKAKTYATALTGFSMTVGPALFGYIVGFSPWTIIPILVLVGIIAGEICRVAIRFRYRGIPPVERNNVQKSLKRPVTSTDLIVTRYEIHHPNWRGQKLRIAHISDLHISDHYPTTFYQEMITQITGTKPDLLLITGDFVTDVNCVSRLPDILAPLTTHCRTFAVLGNHDYWAGADEVAQVVRAAGVNLVGNACQHLQIEGSHDIFICGYERPWGADQLHIPSTAADAFIIVLTHTPDNIYRLSANGAHAVFAGHYHAGQFRIPYLGSLVIPSIYGRRFDHGHFIVNGAHLFVTSGIGVTVLPFRVYCQPDIFIVDFL
jgi:predicted MPP superfamily phosphohydrolase